MKIVNGLPALETVDVKRNFLENVIGRAMGGAGDALGVITNIQTLAILSSEGGKMFEEWLDEERSEFYRRGYDDCRNDMEKRGR